MNKEKNIQIKFVIDSRLNCAFRQILGLKKTTIQRVLENLLRDYVYANLDVMFQQQK